MPDLEGHIGNLMVITNPAFILSCGICPQHPNTHTLLYRGLALDVTIRSKEFLPGGGWVFILEFFLYNTLQTERKWTITETHGRPKQSSSFAGCPKNAYWYISTPPTACTVKWTGTSSCLRVNLILSQTQQSNLTQAPRLVLRAKYMTQTFSKLALPHRPPL